MCAAGRISCLPENEHIYTVLFNFLVKIVSMIFCVYFFWEKLFLCWQHWWRRPGLVWSGGRVFGACHVQSVTHCTHEQELMPVLLKATALSCVFIDLFCLLMVDDLQEHRAEAALYSSREFKCSVTLHFEGSFSLLIVAFRLNILYMSGRAPKLWFGFPHPLT